MKKFEEWLQEKDEYIYNEIDWKNVGRSAALAGTLAAGGMMGNSASAGGMRQITPSRSQSQTDTRMRQITPSAHNANTISNFWTARGSVYTPSKGNGVVVKSGTNVSKDTLTDHKIDLSATRINTPFKVTTASGMGLTEEEAIKDALLNASNYIAGLNVDSETLVKNDRLEKDRVTTTGQAVIGKFSIVDVKNDNQIVRVSIKAEVQKRIDDSPTGSEDHRRFDNGKFRMFKTTLHR